MRLIDADEFIKEMNNRCESAIKWGINGIADHNEEIKIRAEQAIATFCEASLTAKKMPTIDAEPIRHGRWHHIKAYKGADFGFYQCSVCGDAWWFTTKYCANCGSKMEGVEE